MSTQVIPEQRILRCDCCGKAINTSSRDMWIRINYNDRDLTGSIVAGHSEELDIGQCCSLDVRKLISQIKGIKP